MASIRVDNKSTSYISVEVYNLNYSYPDKRFTFYRDGTQVFTYTMTIPTSTYAFYYTYDGLDSGTSYNLEVDIEMFVPGLGYNTEDELSITASTDGGGGGGTWSLVTERSFTSIDTERFLDMTISAGEVHRCAVTFASSGTATFYTTGSKDTRGYLSTSTSFDDDNGKPNNDIADDDDSGDGNNFSITYNVTAGTTYYVWVRLYSASNSGSVTLYITPPTGGGGGEWTLTIGGNQQNISSQTSFSMSLNEGQTRLIGLSFANSGTVTFYSTGSGDTIGFLAPSLTGFDSSTGNPTSILVQNDDGGEGNNFQFTYYVTAGTDYSLFVRNYAIGAASSAVVYVVPESLSTPTYSISNTSNSVTFTVQNRGSYYMRFYVRYNGSSTAKVYDSEEVEGGYVAQDVYTVTGLSPGTSYAVNAYYATTRYNPSDGTAIGTQYFTTGGSSIALWDWDASNGSATATQTRHAYTAITNHGNLSDFSYKVWNDLCGKVNDAITAKGYSWSSSSGYLTYSNTLMTTSDKELTAMRFNTLRYQIGRFISTTGITNRSRGDTVYGWYFVDLADYLNDLINSI